MRFRELLRLAIACLIVAPGFGTAWAAGLEVQPAEVTLTGPHASQRLLVLASADGRVVGDRTARARFTTSDPQVAVVDAAGTVKAVGDGEATVTATLDAQQATARVSVRKVKEPFTWSFRNHVIPLLTRAGCNSGACHGALAGKGGLKLSLRGYDPAADHFVLTRQALGRRVDRVEPAQQPDAAQADHDRGPRRQPEARGRLARLPHPGRLDRLGGAGPAAR
jgi:hypothetical protein